MNALKRRETEHSRDRQQQILTAIAVFQRRNGFSPTLRELGALVGMRTPSAAFKRRRADAQARQRNRRAIQRVFGAASA